MNQRRVFVSGCFDMLHSGHVAFLTEAAAYGELYVGIGADETVKELKGRYPITNQDERRYMIEALRCVKQCRVNPGSGFLDFGDLLDEIRPDVFVVNEDGHSHEKERLMRDKGIEYVVLERRPYGNLPARSTTALRGRTLMPFRIDLAGGWLDQPFVSKHHPGPVLTISIEPTIDFNARSGMASSTRNKAIHLWKTGIPAGDPELVARVLFSYDNPPGTTQFSGSQDALGIVLPGLNRLYYAGDYWPDHIDRVKDEGVLSWLESHLKLVTLGPRQDDYDVLSHTRISAERARLLSVAAERCWDAILSRDLAAFGRAFRDSFEAQVDMFPHMLSPQVRQAIERWAPDAAGWKLSGAGGGGYLILVTERPLDGAVGIRIRRNDL